VTGPEQPQPDQPRVAELEQKLDSLSEQVESLTGELGRNSRLAGEEALGAELLAARDLVAHFGIAWETAEQLGGVWRDQTRLCFEDYRRTVSRLASGTRAGPGVMGEHIERRINHLADGAEQTARVLFRQSELAAASLTGLWAPLAGVIRRDWAPGLRGSGFRGSGFRGSRFRGPDRFQGR